MCGPRPFWPEHPSQARTTTCPVALYIDWSRIAMLPYTMPFFHLFVHPSVCPFIYQSIDPSIHQSIDQSIHQSIDWLINRSIHLSIDLSIHRSIDSSIDRSIHPSIHPSMNVVACQSWYVSPPVIYECMLHSTLVISHGPQQSGIGENSTRWSKYHVKCIHHMTLNYQLKWCQSWDSLTYQIHIKSVNGASKYPN